MFQISHMQAVEAIKVHDCLQDLHTERARIFWSTTQKNNNDWHCKIVEPTQEEIARLAQLIKNGYGLYLAS